MSAAPARGSSTDAAPSGLGFALGLAHRGRRRAFEAGLGDLGLTAPQAAVLRMIAAHPGCGVRQLARMLGTDAMNIRRITETLLAAQLCEARRDPADARRRPLALTGAGIALAALADERAEMDERRLKAGLGEALYDELLAGLRRLVELDTGRDVALSGVGRTGQMATPRRQRTVSCERLR
jgi:DNA-binding MarR family transcriptional regulator